MLPGLDLTIPAGQTAALVGATGAGKTTIARLMARFYDPGQGRVLLDGVDLRELSEPTLRREVVLITQENFLFTGTIAENIELGRPGASRAEIEAAARAIGAHGFISALPGRLRRAGRQARRAAFGRAAAADLVHPRVPGRAGRAGAGRGHLAARHPQRAAGAAGAAHDPGRAHRRDHRAPAVHGADRRPGAGARPAAGSWRTARRPSCWPRAASTPPCTRAGRRAWPEQAHPGVAPGGTCRG